MSLSPEQVLAAGDAWDRISRSGRFIVGTLGNSLGVCPADPNSKWCDIAAHHRIEIAHRIFLLRDFLNEVLP